MWLGLEDNDEDGEDDGDDVADELDEIQCMELLPATPVAETASATANKVQHQNSAVANDISVDSLIFQLDHLNVKDK